VAETTKRPLRASLSKRLRAAVVIVALAVIGGGGTLLENEPSDIPRTKARPIPDPAKAPALGERVPPGFRLTAVEDWSFLDGVHREWTSLARTSLRSDGLVVMTNRTSGYQLLSRTRRVPPGRYRVTCRFRIVKGALSLAVLDSVGQAFLTSGTYTEADGPGTLALSVPFTTRERRSISVILSNGSPTGRSEWLLTSVTLERMERVTPQPE
jgi:hypothetical protein